MQDNAVHSLRWILRESKTQYPKLFLAILCVIVRVVASLSVPVVIYFAIDNMIAQTLTLSQVFYWLMFCILLIVTRYIAFFLAVLLSHAAAFTLIADIKIELSKKLLRLPISFFSDNHSADIRQIINEDVGRIEQFIAHHITDFFTALITPVLATLIIWYFYWPLAIVALLPMPIAFLMQAITFRGYAGKVENYQSALMGMNRQSEQLIRGIAALRMLSGIGDSIKKINASVKKYIVVVNDWTRQASLPFSLLKVGMDFGFIFLLPVSIYLLAYDVINIAEFVLFMMLGLTLTEPFYNLLMFSGLLSQILEGIKRIEKVQNTKETAYGSMPWPKKVPRLSLDSVSYRFPQRGRWALDNFSFLIEPEEKIAIIGPSGSGKSTLLQLMAGFYLPQKGVFCVEGRSLWEYSEMEVYKNIAYVMQDNHIFSSSIKNNITLGRNVDDKVLWDAIEDSQVKKIIHDKPEGLDYMLAGRQTRLSGGEKQRVAIARALIKNAGVYFFDEATRFFDHDTEKSIMLSLLSRLKLCTVVYVTHRRESADLADRIVVMDEGSIVSVGSPQYLQTHCRHYNGLFMTDSKNNLLYGDGNG